MGNGPFITNGQSYHPQFETSNYGTKSDPTMIMFNIYSLNEGRPNAVQNQA